MEVLSVENAGRDWLTSAGAAHAEHISQETRMRNSSPTADSSQCSGAKGMSGPRCRQKLCNISQLPSISLDWVSFEGVPLLQCTICAVTNVHLVHLETCC